MSLVLALLTSFGYGVSDYLAGRVARRMDPALLVLCSQTAQVGVVAVLIAGRPAAADDLSWGLAAGLINAIGFVLYYQALAQGPAVLVAPIVAASPAVPVAVAAALGDSLGPVGYLGLLVTVMGVVTTVSTSGDAPDTAPSPCRGAVRVRAKGRQRFWRPYPCVMLALTATAVFGLALVILDAASKRPTADLLWVTAGLQIGALPPPMIRLWAIRRQVHAPTRADILPIAAIGGSNLAADMAVAYAFSDGHLGVISVLASLGPVLTVALARLHDGERATARQGIGALLTLSGVVPTSNANTPGRATQ
jgi:drug/metabolite transporter (DMT)-like permease